MTADATPTYEELQIRLAAAENALTAIRNDEVDAIVSTGNIYLVRLREIERALRQSEETLETRIHQRTKGLEEKNVALEREIANSKSLQAQLKNQTEKLINAYRQRDFLSRNLVDFLERDRREIGNTLHDQIGQMLTGVSLQLEELSRMETEDGAVRLGERLEPIQGLLRDAMDQIRNISRHLRPEILERFGLITAVTDFIDDIRQHYDLSIRFYTKGISQDFKDGEKDLAVYRIIQESVHNALKYAAATEIFINLTERNGVLFLSIEDNGIGFDYNDFSAKQYSQGRTHLGISIMRERAFTAGGVFRIDTAPGRGVCIQAEIPLFETDDKETDEFFSGLNHLLSGGGGGDVAEKARVLIADDHHIVAEGITNFLSRESDFEVIGSAADGRRAISMLKSLKPDIVVLDISMPDLDGIKAAYEIKSFDQRVRILIYTMSVSKAHVTLPCLKPAWADMC
jgi:signal transduction histidine kinase/CheY-like chemotaxis protein